MDLRNSNGFELRNFYFTTVQKLFSKIFIRSVKMHASCGAQFRYFKIKEVKNPSIRLKILTYESPMQSYIKNRMKSGSRLNLKVINQYLLSSSEL